MVAYRWARLRSVRKQTKEQKSMLQRCTAGPGTMGKAEFFRCKLPNQQALPTIHKGATMNKIILAFEFVCLEKKNQTELFSSRSAWIRRFTSLVLLILLSSWKHTHILTRFIYFFFFLPCFLQQPFRKRNTTVTSGKVVSGGCLSWRYRICTLQG